MTRMLNEEDVDAIVKGLESMFLRLELHAEDLAMDTAAGFDEAHNRIDAVEAEAERLRTIVEKVERGVIGLTERGRELHLGQLEDLELSRQLYSRLTG